MQELLHGVINDKNLLMLLCNKCVLCIFGALFLNTPLMIRGQYQPKHFRMEIKRNKKHTFDSAHFVSDHLFCHKCSHF